MQLHSWRNAHFKQQSPTHILLTNSLYIQPLIVYSPTYSIATHPLYVHLLTLYSVYEIHCRSEDKI